MAESSVQKVVLCSFKKNNYVIYSYNQERILSTKRKVYPFLFVFITRSYNNLFSMSVHFTYTCVPSLILLAFTSSLASSVLPAPTAQVSNVKVERVNNNRAALVSWTPLTLHQARGFSVYFVTYQPSSQAGRVVCAVSTVNATNSSVLTGDLDPTTEYTFSVDVGTAGGEERSILGPGESMLLKCILCTAQLSADDAYI